MVRLRPGDPETIGGYPLEGRLGAGGMGTVFLARTASGRPVAIKLIHRQFADDDEFRTRFRQEVAAARKVSGAFTAAVVDADTTGDHPWMATTYIAGPTLAQRIAADGSLNGPALRTLSIGLAEALRDIHRAGVVHRDLKPSNVVLSPEGPRVIDFGISRAAGHETLTMTGRVIGTPPFMSPEQLQAPREVGPESDVFSLATLLVYAATGQGPFDADSPYMTAYQVVHEAPELSAVPDLLRAVVEPCLAKSRDDRPSADELLVQLRDLPERLSAPEGAATVTGRRKDTATQADAGARPSDADTRPPGTAPVARPADDHTPAHTTGTRTTAGHASAGRPPYSLRSVHGLRTRSARGLRRRWRTVLGVALAVAAISTGVTRLASSSGGAEAGPDREPAGGGSVTVVEKPPSGFRPWHKTVRGGKILDELRCVPSGDAVYCGGGGVLAARLDAADGGQVWKRTSPGVPVQGVHLVGVTGDTVLGYRLPADDSEAEEVVALSTEDGEELWSARLATRSQLFTGQSRDALLAGSTVLSVDPSLTGIEARRADSGAVRWTTAFPAGAECVPLSAGERLYAMCAPRAEAESVSVTHVTLRTLDARTGALGEAVEVTGPLRPMGEANGSLVLLRERTAGSGFDGYTEVVRLDPDTGRVSSAPIESYSGTTPGLAGGRLYFSAPGGRISSVDPVTGERMWSTATSVETASGPVLCDKVLYFSSASGRVAALDERNGRVKWSTDATSDTVSGEVAASARVSVAGGALIVTAGDNTVFGFDRTKPPKTK